MSSGLLLGIDVGTSSVKAGVFDPEGRLLGSGRVPYAIDVPHPGWAQCDPEIWWKGVVQALADACRNAGLSPVDISAVGVDVLFPAVFPATADGRPLHPAILYCDGRSLEQVRAIEEAMTRHAYEAETGNALMPGTCAVTGLAWLRDQEPGIYRDTHQFMWANTFIAHRLTGTTGVDVSMAALSGLCSIDKPGTWSSGLCERLHIDPDKLPPIGASVEVVGPVSAAGAAATGLREGIPVVHGCGDVPACAVGAGVAAPGHAVYIAGSSDCVAAPLEAPSPDRRWANCAFLHAGRWLGIGTTTSSGVSVDWFCRQFLRGEVDPLAAMTTLAGRVDPAASGLVFTPYLQGERTPLWDPLARGTFLGLSASTTVAEMARAVFEGTAFGLRHVMECHREVSSVPLSEFRAVGGGVKNPLWNQIKADVLNQPIRILGFEETGMLGAALLAGIGAGTYASLDDAVQAARHITGGMDIEPDPQNVERYEALFAVYRDVYPATRDIVHRLAPR